MLPKKMALEQSPERQGITSELKGSVVGGQRVKISWVVEAPATGNRIVIGSLKGEMGNT